MDEKKKSDSKMQHPDESSQKELLASELKYRRLFETAKDGITNGLDKVEDNILADELHDERAALGQLRRQVARVHRRLTGLHTLFQRLDPPGAGDAVSPLLHIATDWPGSKKCTLNGRSSGN